MTDSIEQERALGKLIFEVLRLSGRLTLEGDALMQPIGLTSARWQIMGVIAYLAKPDTVSGLARTMGLSRQSVQRIANELQSTGLVAFRPNPAHKRSPLLELTAQGKAVYQQAEQKRIPWTGKLAAQIGDHDLTAALLALTSLRSALEQSDNHGEID